jgi:hypothetical protein
MAMGGRRCKEWGAADARSSKWKKKREVLAVITSVLRSESIAYYFLNIGKILRDLGRNATRCSRAESTALLFIGSGLACSESIS